VSIQGGISKAFGISERRQFKARAVQAQTSRRGHFKAWDFKANIGAGVSGSRHFKRRHLRSAGHLEAQASRRGHFKAQAFQARGISRHEAFQAQAFKDAHISGAGIQAQLRRERRAFRTRA
jgi:hypothetical protein